MFRSAAAGCPTRRAVPPGLLGLPNPLARQAISLLLVDTYLERMADHVTNIGERVWYMETGKLKELHE